MKFLKALFRVLYPSFNIGIKSPSRVMVSIKGEGLAFSIATTNGNTSERK